MKPLAIEARGLTRDFKTVRAVDTLDLSIPTGSVYGLLGPNGAGKTTTIHLLLGLIKPTAGSARILGLNPHREGAEARARAGALLEHHGLYERLSVERNLDYFGRIQQMSLGDRRERARELLQRIELWDRRRELVGKWSKGMKQKLAVARALMHRPAVVFLDEPTAGHDPKAAKDLRDELRTFVTQESATVFLSTHNLAEAESLCDRIGILFNGRLQAEGTAPELRTRGMKGRIIVEGSGWDKGLSATLGRRNEVASVRVERDRLIIELARAAPAAPLVAALVRAGAEVEEVRREKASLEEAYIAIAKEGG